MYNLNGFISDQLPKTYQRKPNYQNLPKQMPKDPYRSNIHPPIINNQHNKQNGLPIVLENQTSITTNYFRILIDNKISKYDMIHPNKLWKQMKKGDIHSAGKFKRSQNLRNIINTHLFDDAIKGKKNKMINQEPKNQSQNRYKIILQQFYGSPLCHNNNTQDNKTKFTNNKSSLQLKRYNSSKKSIVKCDQVIVKSDNKQNKAQSNNSRWLVNGAYSRDNKRVLTIINNRSSSYKQLHCNKKRLLL